MKFKTTLVLLGVAVALLVLVLFVLPRKPVEEPAGAQGPQVTDLQAEEVERIVLSGGPEMIELRKDDQGEWRLVEPIQAQADFSEADRLAEDLSRLRAERVADESPSDLSAYGLPGREVRLWLKGQPESVRILLGDENPVDGTLYGQRAGEKRVVLLPVSMKTLLDKKSFDYRKKDIFSFETSKVSRIAVRAKDDAWQAARRDEEWFLEKPVSGLAERFRLEGVINSLSGLRATEFISEQKTDADLKAFGLDKAEVEVELSLPASGQDVKFFLSRKDDKAFATTSASGKIIAVESYILADLAKKPEELREKGVDVFNAWEADRLSLKSGSLAVTLSKDKEGRWRFESGGLGEADSSRVESFIRQVDSLQAVEFIDRPGPLASYGLDKPRAEIVIGVKDPEGKARRVTVLVGAEDTEKKQTVVKNPRLGYLLRVDSSFLADIPKTAEDWKKSEEDKASDEIES